MIISPVSARASLRLGLLLEGFKSPCFWASSLSDFGVPIAVSPTDCQAEYFDHTRKSRPT